MSCNIQQKSLLDQAQDYVDCPLSTIPDHQVKAMFMAVLLSMSLKLDAMNELLEDVKDNTTPAP